MGFKDAALPLKEQALADRIGENVARALAEDRLIRTGQMPEQFVLREGRAERVRS